MYTLLSQIFDSRLSLIFAYCCCIPLPLNAFSIGAVSAISLLFLSSDTGPDDPVSPAAGLRLRNDTARIWGFAYLATFMCFVNTTARPMWTLAICEWFFIHFFAPTTTELRALGRQYQLCRPSSAARKSIARHRCQGTVFASREVVTGEAYTQFEASEFEGLREGVRPRPQDL